MSENLSTPKELTEQELAEFEKEATGVTTEDFIDEEERK